MGERILEILIKQIITKIKQPDEINNHPAVLCFKISSVTELNPALFLHPFVVVNFSDISRTVVMKQHYNNIIFGKLMLKLFDSGNGTSGRITTENAFFLGYFAGIQCAVFIVTFFKMIDNGHIIVFRDNIFANTFGNIRVSIFGMQFAGFMIFLQDGSVSIYPNDFYIWIFF